MNKHIKKTLIGIGALIGTVVIIAGGYVGYVIFSYNRIGDCKLDVNNNSSNKEIKVGDNLKAATYNIGFGAYSQDYTFFLDTGYDEEGNETCGYYSKAKSKEDVLFNTNGAINTTTNLNLDFVLFQEVDTNSTRSFHINQKDKIIEKYSTYDNTFAINFHSPFLPYPLYDMHGSVNAGLLTISNYQIQEANRVEYTISDSLSKLFDLDRCFSYSKIKTSNNKYLYLVNSHMSAYDSGGTIREKQIKQLNDFLTKCKKEDAYVVVGGDYNHDLLGNNPNYSYDDKKVPFDVNKKTPDWVSSFFNQNKESPLVEGYSVVASDNTPTCRNNDMEWEEGKTYTCVVDGFIVSNNIEIIAHQNIKTKNGKKGVDGFAFSDHDPAYIEFKLK